MKSFIAALIIAAAVITFVIANMECVTKLLDEIEQTLSSLPEKISPEADEIIDGLFEKWNESVEKIALTTAYPDIDRADDAINETVCYFRHGANEEYAASLSRAKDALARLKLLSGLNTKSIF
ncbi:MAG: DUF4363 family protein [Clostridiales bacterium]|nr:DUF4363 family protein [Clostridiales bacterium]